MSADAEQFRAEAFRADWSYAVQDVEPALAGLLLGEAARWLWLGVRSGVLRDGGGRLATQLARASQAADPEPADVRLLALPWAVAPGDAVYAAMTRAAADLTPEYLRFLGIVLLSSDAEWSAHQADVLRAVEREAAGRLDGDDVGWFFEGWTYVQPRTGWTPASWRHPETLAATRGGSPVARRMGWIAAQRSTFFADWERVVRGPSAGEAASRIAAAARVASRSARPDDRGVVVIPVTGTADVVVDLAAGLELRSANEGLAARIGEDAEVAGALRRLAVAELRLEAHSGGLWALDAALAAVEVCDELDLPDDAPLAAHATERSREGIRRLLALPEPVRARGGDELREDLQTTLAPVLDRLGGDALAAECRAMLAVWERDLHLLDDAAAATNPVRPLQRLDARARTHAVPRALALSGLIDSHQRLVSVVDPAVGTADVTLPLRRAVVEALTEAAEARTDGAAPDALESRRIAGVLRALVRNGGGPSSGGPPLPDVWVSAGVVGRPPVWVRALEVRGGTLRAVLPTGPGTVTATVAPNVPSTARAEVADAWLCLPDEHRIGAHALLDRAGETSDVRARTLLLRGAEALLEGLDDQDFERVSVRRSLAALGSRPVDDERYGEALGSWAGELLVAVRDERRIAAGELLDVLGAGRFDRDDRRALKIRLDRHAETVTLIDQLDEVLP
ncbi:MAG: hypothetical protein ITG02_02745 [Patulibacter sp.]|nr:hypothetical protein [Patulibacter sp.]